MSKNRFSSQLTIQNPDLWVAPEGPIHVSATQRIQAFCTILLADSSRSPTLLVAYADAAEKRRWGPGSAWLAATWHEPADEYSRNEVLVWNHLSQNLQRIHAAEPQP